MKIAITGHTKGIGRAIKDLLEKDGHELVGASTSTGVNVMRTKSVINWLTKEDPDIFINNVYAPDSQCHILYQFIKNIYIYIYSILLYNRVCNLLYPIAGTELF